jgi:hypothetical protein
MDTSIGVGETKPGVLVIVDRDGNPVDGAAFDAPPSLNSSDPGVFTVANGATFNDINVLGVGPGVATLSADGSSGGTSLQTGVATVTVTPVGGGAFAIDIRF